MNVDITMMCFHRLIALVILLIASCVAANEHKAGSEKSKEIGIQKFVTDFIEQHETEVPGGAFVWYQAEQDSVINTFGISDIATQHMVNENETRFRIASVSKVFVAIAAAKLVEQKKLNLHVSISEYLDLELTQQLKWPVTTLQLLTHTAGFEDKFYADSTLEQSQVQTLKQHLISHLPAQAYKPGSLISYSNYGNSLAALVIESIVNMPFHQYVKQVILAPLNMKHSDYMLDHELSAPFASGYIYDDGILIEQPYTYVHRYPATSMITTATDMQRLIASLVTKNEVITPFMQSLLFRRQFSHHEQLPAMGLAFMEYNKNGQIGWWHDGSHFGYKAELMIIPERNAGFFVVTNSSSSNMAATLRHQLYQYVFTEQKSVKINKALFGDLLQYQGEYRNTRRNHSTFEAIKNLFSHDVKIEVNQDHLVFWGKAYYATSENIFVDNTNGHTLVFSRNLQGELILFLDWGGSPRSYTKLSLFHQSFVQLGILAFLVIALFIMTFVHLSYGKKNTPLAIRILKATPNFLLVSFILFLILYFFNLSLLDIRIGVLGSFVVLLMLPLMALCIQICLYVFCYQIMLNWRGTVSSISICLAIVYFHQYNLIGFWF